jgi:hypothetical protein
MAKSVIQANIQTASGTISVAPNASIEIRNSDTAALVSLWTDRAGTIAQSNPFNADTNGFFRVYATLGRVNITATYGGSSQVWNDVHLTDFTDSSGAGLIGTIAAAWSTVQGFITYLATSTGSSVVGFIQAGTGAVLQTIQTKLREGAVSLVDFGGVVGADCTTALTNAAATGKPIILPYGDIIISAPVTISSSMYGAGTDDNQTTITLTGTGQLIVGDWWCNWSGFLLRSAVNNKIFVKAPAISYFKFTNFRVEKQSAATGQIGIQFDTSIASCYFNKLDDFKFSIDYPVDIIGNSTNVFNANDLGGTMRGYWSNFQSAITCSGQAATDGNLFGGYFETGTNAFNLTAGALRQNRFKMVLDAVTRAFNGSAVTDINTWEILSGGAFTWAGTYPQNQIFIGLDSTKVRATNATASSIANAAAIVLTFDTEVTDLLSEFVHTTGIFTAKNAGYYAVDAAAYSASVAWDAGERWEIKVYKNGAEYSRGDVSIADAATTRQRMARVVTQVYLNGTTDYIDVRVLHNQGAAVALDGTAIANYIDITRLSSPS